MRRIALAIVLVFALAASAAAAAPSKTTVLKAAYNKDLKATILVGAGGLTLYLTTADSASKNSVCTPDPSCRALWPALKPPVTAGAGVKAALLGRTADGKQVTYKHHSLSPQGKHRMHLVFHAEGPASAVHTQLVVDEDGIVFPMVGEHYQNGILIYALSCKTGQ